MTHTKPIQALIELLCRMCNHTDLLWMLPIYAKSGAEHNVPNPISQADLATFVVQNIGENGKLGTEFFSYLVNQNPAWDKPLRAVARSMGLDLNNREDCLQAQLFPPKPGPGELNIVYTMNYKDKISWGLTEVSRIRKPGSTVPVVGATVIINGEEWTVHNKPTYNLDTGQITITLWKKTKDENCGFEQTSSYSSPGR